MPEKEVEFRNKKGQLLKGVLHFRKSRERLPAAVLCHGYRSSKDSSNYPPLCKALTEVDIVALRFDFAGSGESEGNFEDTTVSGQVDDIISAVDFLSSLEAIDKSSIGVFGSSLGGMDALLAATKDARIKALVLRAPVSDFKDIRLKEFQEGLEEWRRKGVTTTISASTGKELKIRYSFYEDGIKHNVYEEAGKLEVPVLIIQGDRDEAVLPESSQALYKALNQPKKIEVIQGATHEFTEDELERLVELAVKWFRNWL